MKRTKIIWNGIKKILEAEDETIGGIDEVLYLRQLLSFKNRAGRELARRTKSAPATSGD